jgi:phosphatidate cytidylyltransferase
MTDDSLFGRPERPDDDEDTANPRPAGAHRAPPAGDEGVRIITADEVAAAGRRAQEEPQAPAPPAARRPRPAPAAPPGNPARPAAPVGGPAVRPIRPVEPSGESSSGESGEDPRPSGEVLLPHWTEPPTGEVPAAVAAEPPPSERWASGPRWRDEHDRWEDDDFASELAHEAGEDVGALSADRPTTGEIASFDDLGAPAPSPRRPGGAPRGPSGPAAGGTGGRNMGQAVGVGVGLAVVGLVLARLGAPWMMVLVEIVVVLAAAEYLSTLRRAGLEPPTLLGLVAVAALPIATYARGEAAIPMVLFLLVVFSMVWFLAGAGPGRPVRDIGTMLLAVLHVGVMGAFAALILRIGPLGGADVDQGVSILVLAVVAVVGYDVGGLFIGSRLGRTPLTDASPNKTREGLLGGVITSVLLVLLAVLVPVIGLTTFTFTQALLFGLACAVAAFLGDLSESLIKRDLGVKDMGDLLPGHGGVLDRFDGMLFVLPTAFYMVLLLF